MRESRAPATDENALDDGKGGISKRQEICDHGAGVTVLAMDDDYSTVDRPIAQHRRTATTHKNITHRMTMMMTRSLY